MSKLITLLLLFISTLSFGQFEEITDGEFPKPINFGQDTFWLFTDLQSILLENVIDNYIGMEQQINLYQENDSIRSSQENVKDITILSQQATIGTLSQAMKSSTEANKASGEATAGIFSIFRGLQDRVVKLERRLGVWVKVAWTAIVVAILEGVIIYIM